MTKSMGQLTPTRTTAYSLLVALFSFIFSHTTTAQHRLGLANSNYGGTTNLMSNPADIAGGRYKTYIGLAQLDAHLTNNYFKFGGLNLNFLTKSDSLSMLKKNGNYLSLGFDLAGASLIQSITPKITIGLSSRVRGSAQGVGVTQSLYNRIGIFKKDQVTDIKGGGLNIGGQLFSEIDLSYAQALIDNKDYGLKLGLTTKKLTGARAAGISLNQVDAQYTKNLDTEKYQITNGDLTVAYGGLGSLDSLTKISISDIFGKNGQGWGFDLGVTYEHRATSFVNRDGTAPYFFRVGASITDLGSIKYNGKNVRYYTTSLKNVNLNSDSTDITNPDDLLKKAGVKLDSSVKSFKATIPTMLRVNADVRLTDLFFVNVNLATNLIGKYALGSQYGSFVAVTPRLETRYFDFSLPLALTNNYKTFGMGFGMRLGFVTFGMDNFTGFAGSASGFNGHFGMNIGLGRRKNSQELAQTEIEKEKEAEVTEAKQEAKERGKKEMQKSAKEVPLSKEAQKKPEVVAAPKVIEKPIKVEVSESAREAIVTKPSTPKVEGKIKEIPAKAPVTTPKPVERTANTNVSPLSSGKMGDCIVFFPNKAAITGNSVICLKEISKFLNANKNIKLNITGSILATEKAADGAALKLERAKAIRNFLIQSGVEASRLAVKTGDSVDAAIIMSAQ
ncbi:MAG: DUF5723 family protein [Saprospiraceae bacterium]|nr:DUF5723 family protein [Saprospiraceae bacterium]